MRRLLILGAGTAGTTIVNKLHRRLPEEWEIVVIDPAPHHVYQPGLLFVPFGRQRPEDLRRNVADLLPTGVRLIAEAVDRIFPSEKRVAYGHDQSLTYDQLVIATGTSPRPDQTPGLLENGWRSRVHEFYTPEGATALAPALESFQGGRLVMHISELPIKCPVAPLEFIFLADDYFKERGIRHRVELVYVTPLSGAFTKPLAAEKLGGMLAERDIRLEPDFYVERVDEGVLKSYDEREVPFDLLVTVPVNMGAAFVGRSGLGDELDHVRVDAGTFLVEGHTDVFAVGDAAALPISKAGSVTHFAVDVFVENFLDHISGRPMEKRFDGHANCFVESGAGKALLIDFNYDTEPLPGTYPLPGVGPLRLLRESRINHWAKLSFEQIYWHLLVKGRWLPVSSQMSMAGKSRPEREEITQ